MIVQLTQKLLKGFLGLLAISLTLFMTSILIHSCKKNDSFVSSRNSEVTKNLKIFSQAINESASNIKNITSFTTNPTQVGTQFIEDVDYPAINLLRSYGVTDQEMITEFGSLDSGKIVLAAIAVLASEQLIDSGKTYTMFVDEDYVSNTSAIFGISTASAQSSSLQAPDPDTIGVCIMDALGVNAAIGIISNGIQGLGKKAIMKIIKKVASRTLGPIGIALAVYDFLDCMDWI